jgi:hypothetical protein
LAAAVIGVLVSSPVAARDAAFLDPGTLGSGGPGDEAVKVEPKNEIDIGDTVVGMTRRTTLFFVNESPAAVRVDKVDLNSDANVTATVSNDDCSKQGSIAPQSRCSVEISVTPSGPGAWTVEALMTHNGAGRLARAKISGKTSGSVDTEKKETGLAVSSKEASPVDFGEVDLNAKAVRSALMVNDSPEPITLYSIDVIEANNGLERLDQGCTVDMELKPGESCPVTLVWTPSEGGQISTDLIIRHSGRLGFAVIPIRGKAKGGAEPQSNQKVSMDSKGTAKSAASPPPPTADELEKATSGKIAPLSASALPAGAGTGMPAPTGPMRLIGTVGNRAVLLLPDETTKVVGTGDEFTLDDDKTVKVKNVTAKSVTLMIGDKIKELTLGEAPELVAKAAAAEAASKSDGKVTTGPGATNTNANAKQGTPIGAANPPLSPAAAGRALSGAGGNGNIAGASP